jgi:hypothetical protein
MQHGDDDGDEWGLETLPLDDSFPLQNDDFPLQNDDFLLQNDDNVDRLGDSFEWIFDDAGTEDDASIEDQELDDLFNVVYEGIEREHTKPQKRVAAETAHAKITNTMAVYSELDAKELRTLIAKLEKVMQVMVISWESKCVDTEDTNNTYMSARDSNMHRNREFILGLKLPAPHTKSPKKRKRGNSMIDQRQERSLCLIEDNLPYLNHSWGRSDAIQQMIVTNSMGGQHQTADELYGFIQACTCFQVNNSETDIYTFCYTWKKILNDTLSIKMSTTKENTIAKDTQQYLRVTRHVISFISVFFYTNQWRDTLTDKMSGDIENINDAVSDFVSAVHSRYKDEVIFKYMQDNREYEEACEPCCNYLDKNKDTIESHAYVVQHGAFVYEQLKEFMRTFKLHDLIGVARISDLPVSFDTFIHKLYLLLICSPKVQIGLLEGCIEKMYRERSREKKLLFAYFICLLGFDKSVRNVCISQTLSQRRLEILSVFKAFELFIANTNSVKALQAKEADVGISEIMTQVKNDICRRSRISSSGQKADKRKNPSDYFTSTGSTVTKQFTLVSRVAQEIATWNRRHLVSNTNESTEDMAVCKLFLSMLKEQKTSGTCLTLDDTSLTYYLQEPNFLPANISFYRETLSRLAMCCKNIKSLPESHAPGDVTKALGCETEGALFELNLKLTALVFFAEQIGFLVSALHRNLLGEDSPPKQPVGINVSDAFHLASQKRQHIGATRHFFTKSQGSSGNGHGKGGDSLKTKEDKINSFMSRCAAACTGEDTELNAVISNILMRVKNNELLPQQHTKLQETQQVLNSISIIVLSAIGIGVKWCDEAKTLKVIGNSPVSQKLTECEQELQKTQFGLYISTEHQDEPSDYATNVDMFQQLNALYNLTKKTIVPADVFKQGQPKRGKRLGGNRGGRNRGGCLFQDSGIVYHEYARSKTSVSTTSLVPELKLLHDELLELSERSEKAKSTISEDDSKLIGILCNDIARICDSHKPLQPIKSLPDMASMSDLTPNDLTQIKPIDLRAQSIGEAACKAIDGCGPYLPFGFNPDDMSSYYEAVQNEITSRHFADELESELYKRAEHLKDMSPANEDKDKCGNLLVHAIYNTIMNPGAPADICSCLGGSSIDGFVYIDAVDTKAFRLDLGLHNDRTTLLHATKRTKPRLWLNYLKTTEPTTNLHTNVYGPFDPTQSHQCKPTCRSSHAMSRHHVPLSNLNI